MSQDPQFLNEAELDNYLQMLPSTDKDGKVFGIVINDDSSEAVYKVYPENGTDFKLQEIYKYTGKPIQMIYVRGDLVMLLNEEGKLSRLPLNTKATNIADVMPFDVIVGNVLICASTSAL